MIVANIRIKVRPDQKVGLVTALRSMLGPTSVERGCRGCRLYQDLADEDSLYWVEEWVDRESLDRHLRSPDYLNILEVLEHAVEKPDVTFDTVQRTHGIELIAEARSADRNMG